MTNFLKRWLQDEHTQKPKDPTPPPSNPPAPTRLLDVIGEHEFDAWHYDEADNVWRVYSNPITKMLSAWLNGTHISNWSHVQARGLYHDYGISDSIPAIVRNAIVAGQYELVEDGELELITPIGKNTAPIDETAQPALTWQIGLIVHRIKMTLDVLTTWAGQHHHSFLMKYEYYENQVMELIDMLGTLKVSDIEGHYSINGVNHTYRIENGNRFYADGELLEMRK